MGALSTLINGHAFDFSSIKLSFSATPVSVEIEALAINYQHALEPEELRGQGPMPLYDTTGIYSSSASLEMYLSEWRALRKNLAAAPGAGGYMQKRFDITVNYAESGETAVEDTLRGCRVIRAGKAYRRSTEPLTVSIDLYVRQVLEDGVSAVEAGFGELISGLTGGL